jgi:hypothetical protein
MERSKMGAKSSLAGYEVEFIPIERRLMDRRDETRNLMRPVLNERRKTSGRRATDMLDLTGARTLPQAS